MKITKFTYFFFVFYASQRTEKSHIKEDKYLYLIMKCMYVTVLITTTLRVFS